MAENQNNNVEFTSNKDQHLKRSLKARHMNMIALGGAIGTGLFVAGGEVVSTAGPGGALVAYGLIGIMVYFLMTSLGEMATYLPIPGSFGTYAKRYVDPAFGFALGWNYWFNWAITLAAEVLAGALIMYSLASRLLLYSYSCSVALCLSLALEAHLQDLRTGQ